MRNGRRGAASARKRTNTPDVSDIGALVKVATAEEAFFVKCDEETNPPESIDAGRVITLIGLAPVKPAELIIFRIGQHASGTTIESEGAAHG